MTRFDTALMVDWSGGNDRGAVPKADAIWACLARAGVTDAPVYLRNRQEAEAWITDVIDRELTAGRRVIAGFDFPFGYPEGFAGALVGTANPLILWSWFEARIEDSPKANNRFDVAGEINALYPAEGPFWGNALKRDIAHLPRKKHLTRPNGLSEKRRVERRAKGAFSVWQLAGAGSVGSQVMMGLPVLSRLRRRFASQARVWPFEALDTSLALVEIWPSLFVGPPPGDMVKDAWQVQEVARVVSALPEETVGRMLCVDAPEEGWILGVGNGDEEVLRAHAV
ncbi:molybdopterin guanine dinucleotide synthesis [Marivita hallyeonensis]|uniref:Molybdopterin molybdotransferase n=1 Tax=Marivita hallyeonensis TaxID=996342 RepID=A0A1M5UTF1_9RHOB|nr:molybdopterin guanine dinucleotide synthesis [Marivita hallyeonensis]SHH66251.1 hypothetical protein SAMN05443551_2792 [Marivita hallyeonensis]